MTPQELLEEATRKSNEAYAARDAARNVPDAPAPAGLMDAVNAAMAPAPTLAGTAAAAAMAPGGTLGDALRAAAASAYSGTAERGDEAKQQSERDKWRASMGYAPNSAAPPAGAPVNMVPINAPAGPAPTGMPTPKTQSYGGTRVAPSWQPVQRTTTPLTEAEGVAALQQLGGSRAQYEAALTSAATQLGDANEAAQFAELDRQAIDRYAEADARKRATERAQELGAAQKKVAEGEVDPNKLLRNMSTGSAVIAGIAAIMGGIGQGLTGGQRNEAVSTLQMAIDRDISAQRDNLSKNERMLDYIRARYGDEDKWLNEQRSLQYAAVDSKLRMAENMSKDADTKQRIAAARYDLTKGAISDVVQVAAQSRPQETQRFDPGGVRGGGTVLQNRAEMVAAIAARSATGDPEKDQATLERVNKMPDRQLASLGAAVGMMPAMGGTGGANPNAVSTPVGSFVVADKKAREEIQGRAVGLEGMRIARDQMAAALARGDSVAARAAAVNFVEKASIANGQGVVRAEDYQQSGVLGQFSQLNGDAYVTGSAERAISAADALMRTQTGQFASAVRTYGGKPVDGGASTAKPRTTERAKE